MPPLVTDHQKSTEKVQSYMQLSKEAESDILTMYGTVISQFRERHATNRNESQCYLSSYKLLW